MKTKFQVFTLKQTEVITSVSLSSDGLTTEEDSITISIFEFECDSELECFERLSKWDSVHEVEIKKVITTGI